MITKFKIYENFDTDFKPNDIIRCVYDDNYGEKFLVMIVYGSILNVKSLKNGIRTNWSVKHFVKEEDWDLYQNSKKFNL